MKKRPAPCCGDNTAGWRPLNTSQRWARLIVGVALLSLVPALPWSSVAWVVLVAIAGWLGATHILAGATAYPGCPELGVVPSLLLGRWVKIGCTPWRWLDARFRFTAE